MKKHVKQGRDLSALIHYVAAFGRQVTNIVAVRRDGVWSLTWAFVDET
jgi:hypothetical protein